MKAFLGIPFLRIIIPFIVGLFVGIRFDVPHVPLFYFLLLFGPLIFLNFYQRGGKPHKWIFLVCADLFLFIYGMDLVHNKRLNKQPEYYGNQVNTDSMITFVAVINDLPQVKTKFIKTDLKILETKTDTGYKRAIGNTIAYFRIGSLSRNLKPGQTVFIRSRLQELSQPKNPFEFDYKTYLQNKQVYHTVFVDSTAFVVLPGKSLLNPVWELGLRCKEIVLYRLKHSALSSNAYAICAALLTGYDDDIDKSVMEAFSHSGTLHVLSVSGLHTGLIYVVLNFLFDLLDRKRKYKLPRFLLITLFLWFFALITGFSAPVLRAVIMFNLLGFGRIYFRTDYRNQLNILLVSAFVLLCYNPFYILDVGFLLSYFALFGLIYFQPALSVKWQPENKVLNSLWQSSTASIAATISTLPLTLFYFKQFPLWFIICNVVVVPATFVLLGFALGVVLKIKFMSILANYLVQGLIWFIDLFNSKDLGFIDNIHFTFSDACFLSVFIFLVSIALQYRLPKQLIASFIVLVVWQFVSIVESFNLKNQSTFTVYNIKNKTTVSAKNKNNVYLNDKDLQAFNFHIKPQLISFNYPSLKVSEFNFLKSKSGTILILNKPGSWPDVNPAVITILVVANNFKLLDRDLQKFTCLKTLVLDASNNSYSQARAEELSRKFGLYFYNTRYKGAWLSEL